MIVDYRHSLFRIFPNKNNTTVSFILDYNHYFAYRLSNADDPIAQRLNERLRNNSYPNIGTTCMKDAPPASDKAPYSCGKGDPDFYQPPDFTQVSQYAPCSECFTKTLQVRIFCIPSCMLFRLN